MAYNTAEGRASYTASSGQTEFDFVFKIFSQSDIKVYKTPSGDTPDDTQDILALSTNYTVIIDGDNGGTVTLLSGATAGDTIVIVRDLAVKRDTDYQDNGDLTASTLDNDQNYQTYLAGQANEIQERALRIPDSSVGVDTKIPAASAGALIRYNLAGDGFDLLNANDVFNSSNAISVNTIIDMEALDDTIFKVCIVKDLDRGGTFIWSSTGTANGGTVFAGATGFWNRQYSGAVNVKWFGAVGDGIADDTIAIQSAINFGDNVILEKISTFYNVTDTITVLSNKTITFEWYIKLTNDSSTGAVLLLNGDNITINNPLIDGGTVSTSGENGIGVLGGNNIRINSGDITSCKRGGAGNAFGGKAIQIESGSVEGVLVDGTNMSECFMAMSTVRDGADINPDYGIKFTNIQASNCDILFFVKQANINNTNGLEHTVQLSNFYAINCGAFEGVMQFSRASNVQISNGIIINDPLNTATSLIRGNHRFSSFKNIRFSGNCPSIINLDPSTFAIDSSYVCEGNEYDINYSGTTDYIAAANITTSNRVLQDSVINIITESDVSVKIVGDELRNGYCIVKAQHNGKYVEAITADLFLQSKTNFASISNGINILSMNTSNIKFPSTQYKSTDVNTLDDYEEGTWTPIDDSGATLVFSAAVGHYTKIGRLVSAYFSVTYPSTADGTTAYIGGLPFVSINNGSATCGFAVRYTDIGFFVSASLNPNTSKFVFAKMDGAVVVNSNLSTKTISGIITYMAD